MAEQTPDSIITTRRNEQIIVAELFFNHSSTETCRDKLLKLVLADSSRLSASDGQEPEKTPEKCLYCVTRAQKEAVLFPPDCPVQRGTPQGGKRSGEKVRRS